MTETEWFMARPGSDPSEQAIVLTDRLDAKTPATSIVYIEDDGA